MCESICAATAITVLVVAFFAVGWTVFKTVIFAAEKLEYARNWKDYATGYSILIAMLFLLSLAAVAVTKNVPALNVTPSTVTAEIEDVRTP